MDGNAGEVAKPVCPQTVVAEVTRRCGNHHPTVWGDHFLAYAHLSGANEWEKKQHEHLKEEVRKMLEMSPSKSLQTLDLINAIQCLEVAYHFEYLGNTVIMSHLMFLGSSLTAKEITIKHWLATWKGC
ncbi:terpene synthase 16-like isoform X1 [Nicotiana tomentosiformis]|uniref:terpene synthase 16-like isoform X1 n=1 Tax=Nicotiana tomentosiformis TaxID=4098 RepID=UPI00388CB51F